MTETTTNEATFKELNKNVLLVAINVHRWRGRYKTKNSKIEIADKAVKEDKITSPQWDLLPKPWQIKFATVEAKIRNMIGAVSLKFPVRGIDVIPRLQAASLFERIDDVVAKEFTPLAKAFCEDWHRVVSDTRTTLSPGQFAQAGQHMLASADEMLTKFSVVKYIIPLGGAGDLSSLNAEDSSAFAKEIEQQTRNFLSGTVDSIVTSLQGELNSAVDNLLDRLRDRGVVKEGTMDQVRRAFEKLSNFKFVASPEVMSKLEKAKASLAESDAKALNLDNRHGAGGVSAGLVAALRELREQFATDSQSGAMLGRRNRSVVI